MAIREESKRAKEVSKQVDKKVNTKKVKSVKKPKLKKDKTEAPTRNPITKFFRYVRDSTRELKRVTWPSRRETWKLTFSVLAFTLVFTGLLVLVDYIFRNILERYII